MRNLLLANALAMPCLASAALAQTAESAESDGDIVVTATRTESLLSKTPLAVTAIKGDDLARAGISNPTQLDTAVPNLAITRYNGLQITIRGVTSADNTEKGDPSAAFMLNGIYIARPRPRKSASLILTGSRFCAARRALYTVAIRPQASSTS